MFDDKSRYKNAPTYQVKDHRGRTVTVVQVPAPPVQSNLGTHVRKDGQRLDHLAYRYLDDARGFWRIAEHNGAMQPEWLTEAREILIPQKES